MHLVQFNNKGKKIYYLSYFGYLFLVPFVFYKNSNYKTTFLLTKKTNYELRSSDKVYEPELHFIPLSGNLTQMKYFFESLKKSGKEKIRVAHYGDSGLLGDAITADLREALQEKFGGNGVGLLPITNYQYYYRCTINQSTSNNWTTYSVVTNPYSGFSYGIDGSVTIPKGICWTKYTTSNYFNNLKYFKMAKIFYNDAQPSTIDYSFDNGLIQKATLEGGASIHELKLLAPGNGAESFKFSTTISKQANFYDVSLEDGNGVYVDNFSWSGNTGLGFDYIPKSSFLQFGKMLNYKLFIIAFGANETNFQSSQSNIWYENEMIKIINNLKNELPKTSFLLIGVGDKGFKDGKRFITNPNIPVILKLEEDIAKKTSIAFWNLFDAMGGYGTMVKWVNANPPLALIDYIHPSPLGSKKIGEMLASVIISAFNNYISISK